MIILRVIWLSVRRVRHDLLRILFVVELGYALSLCDEPKVNAFWLALAFSGAAILSSQGDLKYFIDHFTSLKTAQGEIGWLISGPRSGRSPMSWMGTEKT